MKIIIVLKFKICVLWKNRNRYLFKISSNECLLHTVKLMNECKLSEQALLVLRFLLKYIEELTTSSILNICRFQLFKSKHFNFRKGLMKNNISNSEQSFRWALHVKQNMCSMEECATPHFLFTDCNEYLLFIFIFEY